MSANPIELIAGLANTSDVSKADMVAWAKARVPQTFTDASEVQNTDLAGQLAITLKTTGGFYYLDAGDTTSPHDGTGVLVSNDSKRFKLLSSLSAPTTVSLGGVFELQPVTDHFLTGIDGDGTPLHAQPSAANLSNGVTGSGAVVLANSPALVTPTGIVKGDVGLGNVDNTSNATERAASATLTNKTIDVDNNTVSNIETDNFKTNVVDTDGTLTANSDTRLVSQKAVKTYVDQIVAATDAMVFKGVIDCSANPNYPAADRGATYRVSVAGKIGGASGTNVEAGDILICLTDSTASGNQATVGTAWSISQANLDGAVIGPASATSANIATFSGTTGKLIQDSGKALPSGTVVGTTDSQTLTNKTLTSPAITTPTGIVKGDVGLGNVDNTSDATKNAASVTLTSKTLTSPVINTPDLNGGTADSLTSLSIRSTGAAFDMLLATAEAISANRTLSLVLGNTNRTLTLGGNPTINGGTHSGTNTGDQTITLTGDVGGTGAGSFAATIANNAVTLAKMATVATATFLGRTTASTGNVEALTVTQATALLNAMVGDSGAGGTKGLVPAPGAGDASAGRFLKADGTWAVPAGGGGGSGAELPFALAIIGF